MTNVQNDAAKQVTVTVADDGSGTLTVTNSTSTTPVVFANTYTANGSTTLGGTKTLSGREFVEGDDWTLDRKSVV